MAHAPSFWLEFRLPNGRSSLKPLSELCPDLPAQCNTIDDFWGVINACPLSEVRDRFDMTLHFFAPGFRPTWESMPNGAVAKLHAANLATSPGAPPTASFDVLWPVACALVLQWSDPKYHQSLAACSIVGVSSGLDVVKFWIADVSNSNTSACESCRAAWPLEFQASSIDAFKSELSAAMRRAAETAFPESAFPTLAVSLQSNAVAMRKSQRTDSRGGSGHVRQGSNHHHHHNHHHRAHERNVSFGESTNSVDWMSSRGSQVGGIHNQGQPSSNMASPGHGRTRSGIDPFSTSLTGPISLGTPRVGHGRSWSDLSASPIVSIRVNNPYATAVSPPMTAMPPPASMSQSVNPPSRGATPLVSVRVGNVLVGTSPVATFQMSPSAPMPVPVLLDVKRAMAPEPDARSSPPPAPTVSAGHTRVTSEGTAWNRNSSHTSNAKAPQAKEKESVVAVPETTNSAGNSRSNSVLITDDVTPPPSKSATPSTKKTRRGRRAGQKVRERDTFNALATMFKTDEDFEDHGETTPRPATQLSASNAAAGDSDDDNSVVVGRLSPSRLEDVATGHSLDGGSSLQPGHVFMAAAGGSMASLTSPGIRRNDSITQFIETPPAKGGERRSHGRTVSFEVPAPQQHEHRSTSVGSNSSAQHFVHPTHQRRLSDVTTPIPASDPALPHLAAVRKLGSTQGWLELLSLDDEFYSDD